MKKPQLDKLDEKEHIQRELSMEEDKGIEKYEAAEGIAQALQLEQDDVFYALNHISNPTDAVVTAQLADSYQIPLEELTETVKKHGINANLLFSAYLMNPVKSEQPGTRFKDVYKASYSVVKDLESSNYQNLKGLSEIEQLVLTNMASLEGLDEALLSTYGEQARESFQNYRDRIHQSFKRYCQAEADKVGAPDNPPTQAISQSEADRNVNEILQSYINYFYNEDNEEKIKRRQFDSTQKVTLDTQFSDLASHTELREGSYMNSTERLLNEAESDWKIRKASRNIPVEELYKEGLDSIKPVDELKKK